MRFAWVPQNLRSPLRAKSAKRRRLADPLRVRQLERRRVLAASITDIFFSPADLDAGTAVHDTSEGTQITATAAATGQDGLHYDWKVTQGATTLAEGTGPAFNFTPADEGTYTVTLKVVDGFQSSAIRSEDIVVHNVAPQLVNVAGDTINEGETAEVFATIQDPGASDVFDVDVDWKDGAPFDTITGLGGTDKTGIAGNTEYEWTAATRQLKVSHKFVDDNPTGTTNDTYKVTLVARDGDMGTSNTAEADVVVKNVRPVLVVAPNQTVNEGQVLNLSAMGAPPLGLYIDDGKEDTFTATVDWGDGSPIQNPTMFSAPGTGALGGTHVYAENGVYTVKVAVTDDDGGTDTQSFTVTVKNLPPVLVVAVDQTVNEGSELDLSGTGGAPPLGLYIDDGILDTHTVSVDWGDGTVEVPTIFAAPGSAALGGKHAYADNGVYEVKVTVTDDDGGKAMKSFFVTVNNVAPSVNLTGPTSVDEGDDRTWMIGPVVDPGDDTVMQYIVHWGDGETDTFTTAELDALGRMVTHTYLEGPNNYTIRVDLVDEDGEFDDVATLNVTVNNVPPVLVVALDQMVNEGAELDLSGTGGAPPLGLYIDDGILDTHTVTVDWGDGTIETPTIFPAIGSAALGGKHTYADDGVYEVKIKVVDDDGAMAMKSFFVTVKNVAPTVDLTGPANVDEGIANSWLIGPVVDPGNDTVSQYIVHWGDGNTDTYTAAQLNAAGRMVSHTYADGANSYTITVDLVDEDGMYLAVDSLGVTVNNVAPTVAITGPTMVDEGDENTWTIGPVVDPGADTVTHYIVHWGDGDTDTFTAAELNAVGRMVSHTYVEGPNNYIITVDLIDEDGKFDAVDTLAVTVKNVPPVLVVALDQMIDEGSELDLSGMGGHPPLGLFIDPGLLDTHTVTVDWGDGSPLETPTLFPAVGSAALGGKHTYADDGVYEVKVKVVDDDGGMDMKSFFVTVKNVAPTIDITGPTTVDEGSSNTWTIGPVVDPGDDTVSQYIVHWGDGNTDIFTAAQLDGMGRMVSHTYADGPNNYTITVDLVDEDGTYDAVDMLEVTVLNVAPDVDLIGPASVNEGATNSWTIGPVVDPGADTVSQYVVHWGDGNTSTFTAAELEALGGMVSHVYADGPNNYTITVDLVDEDDTYLVVDSLDVTVNNVPPFVDLTGPTSVNEGASSTWQLGPVVDPGDDTVLQYIIHWGDGDTDIFTAAQMATMNRMISHTYADGPTTFTIRVDLVDEDGEFDSVDTLEVTVNNVDPTLTGTSGLELDEGESFTLADLGVGITDPGFDKNGGVETFQVMAIDWGDGHVTNAVNVVNRLSPNGGPTTAGFQHTAHIYADGGPDSNYTVTVTLKDDDGGFVERTFTIHVNNVAPTLHLTDESFSLNEGGTLVVINLGTFTDPGYNNPLNAGNAANGGETAETFTYIVNWGDGTIEEVKVPAIVNNGGPGGSSGQLTTAAFPISHKYKDNDTPNEFDTVVDNKYTITVTLMDDDGGVDVESFEIEVKNVNPTLEPIFATDINAKTGSTTLFLQFSDPGADHFQIMVDWGDRLFEPNPEDRFVVEQLYAGPTPNSFIIVHKYNGPPDPLHPTADITITVKIRDDDFATLGIVQQGESNVEVVTITNPGIQANNVAIDTTPDVPRLDLTMLPTQAVFVADQTGNAQVLQRQDVHGSGGEVAATTERYLELRLVYPDGSESEGYRIKDEALLDLRAFFKTLPDGKYRIYLVRSETKVPRLVIEVDVRRGRVIDVTDDSEGTRDRPPTSEGENAAETQAVPLDEHPLLEAVPAENGQGEKETGRQGELEAGDQQVSLSPHLLVSVSPLAATLLPWSERLDRAFREADETTARRLLRAGRRRRLFQPLAN